MWSCPRCHAAVEDDAWQACWKCGGRRDETPAETAAHEAQRDALRACLRCKTHLTFAGTRKFHHGGGRMDFLLGDLGELFVGRETYDVFFCPACGKVEFYVDGIGEHLRDETSPG